MPVDVSGLGRVGRLFFSYLVWERHRPVTKDELAEALWGETGLPRSWEQMLRASASKLRSVLSAAGLGPEATITSAFGAYQLHLPPDTVVDIEEAGDALAGALLALRRNDPAAAHAAAAAAVTVGSRGFLPGWSGVWVERRQAEVRELRLGALEVLAESAMALGNWREAVAAAESAIDSEPFRETAYQLLMAAHRGAGNPGEALRAYERCRRMLAEELGVNPSAATEAAYLALLSEEPLPSPSDGPAVPLPGALAPDPVGFLVGRTDEIERLRSAFDRVPSRGRQAVVVGGEPGIGKTALVASFAREAHASGAVVLYGRCDEDLGVAYQPFAEALGHYVKHCPSAELGDHVAAHGTELSRIVPELARRLPDAPIAVMTGSEGDRYRLFEAVSDLVDRASRRGPILVVLDDMQWAAPPTLALLRHLLRSRATSILVIATYRHNEVGADHLLAPLLADLRREPDVERLVLAGLDEDAVSTFVEHATDDPQDGSRAALARALLLRTGGNPFFVSEFLRHLAETGAVYRRAGTWSYHEDADGLGLPEGVRDVVARRLRRLSEPANEVLTLAAVVGPDFDLDVLERLAGTGQRDVTLDALDEAVAARIVIEVGSGRYQFSHALVRDTIHSLLTSTRRARLHHRVGTVLAEFLGASDSRLPALAHHFAEAAPDGAAEEAARYALAAARQAIDKAAWEDALSYARLGLSALAAGNGEHLDQRFELLLVEAETLLIAVDNEAAEKVILEAAETARRLGSPERLAQAVSLHLLMFGPWDPSSVAQGEETLALLDESATAWRARILAGLAVSLTYRTDGRSDDASRASLALARASGDQNGLYAALVARAAVLADTHHARERLALEEELLAMGPPSEPVAGTRWIHSLGRGRATGLLVLGDGPGFRDEVEAVAQRVALIGARGGQWQIALWRATVALLDGRFGEVADLAARARGLVPAAVEQWTVQMFEAALEQGRAETVTDDVRRALDVEPENANLRSLSAFLSTEIGDREEALRNVGLLSADDFAAVTTQPAPVSSLAYLAEAVTGLTAKDMAAGLYCRLLPYSGLALVHRTGAHCGGAADRYLGQLAALLGRWDGAERHYRTAMNVEAGLRSPPLLARTKCSYGRMLMQRDHGGDRQRARRLFGVAAETAASAGMERLLAQVSDLV